MSKTSRFIDLTPPSVPARASEKITRRAKAHNKITSATDTEGLDPWLINRKPDLNEEQLKKFELDIEEIRTDVENTLGDNERQYIQRTIRIRWCNEILGRLLIYLSIWGGPAILVLGVLFLAAAKIIENMEIGHNVLHGQYDWMNDPKINSMTYEWDIAITAKAWKHGHNFIHHSYTNIVSKDNDVGFGFMRVHPQMKWNPLHLLQPLVNLLTAVNFQHIAAIYDSQVFQYILPPSWRASTCVPPPGKKEIRKFFSEYLRKSAKIMAIEYILLPALAGPYFLYVICGNFLARLITNLWEYATIFCGHLPQSATFYTVDETSKETKAEWYVRQILAACNMSGNKLFHFMSGHLSHQIEHHLYPDIPAVRYPEMAIKVQQVCHRYGIYYNIDSFPRQLFSTWKRMLKYSLPNSKQENDAFEILAPGVQVNQLHIPAKIVKITKETDLCKSYSLKPEIELKPFQAGMHTNITLQADGRTLHRTYTISSTPASRNTITLTIKKVHKGLVSNWLFDHAQIGDKLHISRPFGDFILPDPLPKKLLMISGGSGITPLMSMLRHVKESTERNQVSIEFIHCASSDDDIIFFDELMQLEQQSKLDLSVRFVIDSQTKFHQGPLTETLLHRLVPDILERETLMCGPGGLIKNVSTILKKSDYPQCRFHTEVFTREQSRFNPTTRDFTLVFKKSEITCKSGEIAHSQYEPKTILQMAEENGLTPQHGCRMGICYLCKAKKLSGKVFNLKTGEISSDKPEEIRVCISVPLEHVEIDL